MKAKTLFAAIMVLFSVSCFSQDSYDKIVNELSRGAKAAKITRIAVLPFSSVESFAPVRDGDIVSERLTTKLINSGKYEVSETAVLGKIAAELKIKNIADLTAENAGKIAKQLDIQALVAGTVFRKTENELEVNARLIKTENAKAVCAVNSTVEIDWAPGKKGNTAPVQPPVLKEGKETAPSASKEAPSAMAPIPREISEHIISMEAEKNKSSPKQAYQKSYFPCAAYNVAAHCDRLGVKGAGFYKVYYSDGWVLTFDESGRLLDRYNVREPDYGK